MNKVPKKLIVMLVAACLLGMLNSPVFAQNTPDVLKVMPSDAMVVIAARSLGQVNQKVSAFVRQLGMPEETQFDIVQMVGEELGLSGELDPAGSLGLCIANLTVADKTAVMFVPVTNSAAAVKAMQATPVDGTTGIFQESDKGIFIKPEGGKYLLLASNPDILSSLAVKSKGVQLSNSVQKIFAESDVAASLNLKTIMPMFRGMAAMAVMSNQDLQKYPALSKLLGDVIDRISEIENIAAGGKIAKEGISLRTELAAQAGSKLSQYLSDGATASISSLAVLPVESPTMAYSYKLSPKMITGPFNAIIDAIAAEPALSDKINKNDIMALKQLIKDFYAVSTGGSGAMYFPPAAGNTSANNGGGNMLTAMRIIQINHMDKAVDMASFMERWSKLLTSISSRAGFPIKMTYNRGVGKVDGISYDKLSVDIAELPIPPQALQAISQSWGGTAMKYDMAMVNGKFQVLGIGTGCLQDAVKLLKTAPKGLNQEPGIKLATSQLPQKANLFYFVNMGKYLQMVLSSNPAIPPMVKSVLGQVKGTLGISTTLDKGRIDSAVFVPMELVQSAVKAGMSMGQAFAAPAGGQTEF